MEHVRQELGRYPPPVVAHLEDSLPGLLAQPDPNGASGPTEFDGIAEQVPGDLLDPRGIAVPVEDALIRGRRPASAPLKGISAYRDDGMA